MIQVNKITLAQMESKAAELGLALPIEQTSVWATYQATIPGRTPWGCVEAVRDGEVIALASFYDYETHGYHYLRSTHGPVWTEAPSAELEAECVAALHDFLRAQEKKAVFARMAVASETAGCEPVLSTCPYNQTLVIDVTGTEDDILARMKPRGRRDVVTWSIVTINGTRAVRYYGASRSETMRQHVTDKLVLFECNDLRDNKGVLDYDMMGIGNDFAPSLMGLNEFKTKFAKNGIVDVAPDRDLPLKKGFYGALKALKKLRDR